MFGFNVDEEPETIYDYLRILVNRKRDDWTLNDYNKFYEETKGSRDILTEKLNKRFGILWYREPTIRPKVTLKRGEYPLELFDQVYLLHSYYDRRYVKRKIKNILHTHDHKSWGKEILDVIDKYYDVTWV